MKMDKILYGVAYYDEYMPYDRVEKDMEMIAAAGMNVIRIAESTWSTWEPQEGFFDFTHLRRMLDASKKYGLSVIIGTPTYAIPTWLAKKCPEILALTHDGQELYGHRQNMDITNPTYLHHAEIIIRKLMEYVKDEPHVIGFQLDNETKSYDTCTPYAQAKFVEYIKEKFPNIEDFNQEFGFDYWSNRINTWEDFPDVRGTINQSLAAEYRKFQRQLVTDFLTWQSNIVAEYKREDQFITQNFDFGWTEHSYGLQPEVDQYTASKCVTIAGGDIYHPSADFLTGKEITVCGNITRGLKQDNYLILETEAQGNPGWLPFPGQLRLQAFSHFGNGANSVMYWHWHSIHNAIETYWKGVLSHDLAENETYRECSTIGKDLKRIGHKLVNLKKHNKIAIVANNEALTGLTQFPTATKDNHGYNRVLRWLADALMDMNIEFDVIPADAALLPMYDCIILPAFYSAREDYLKALDSYVKNGGNLITTYKAGFSDEYLKVYSDTQPHILHKALGLHYDQFTLPYNVTVTYNGQTSDASEWMEMVHCDTAVSLAQYEHHTWNRYTAVAQNNYGKGRTLYLATLFGANTLRAILAEFLGEIIYADTYENTAKLPFDAVSPVTVKHGINNEGRHIMYFLNYSKDPQTVRNIAGNATELLSGGTVSANGTITLEPWGVAILEYSI